MIEPAATRSGRPRSRFISIGVRLAFAAGLTGYLLWKIHPREVLATVADADWRPIAIAVLLALADRALMAYRWVALLCTLEPGRRPPLSALMRVFFVSTFVGTFLPSSVASDALRSYGMRKLNVAGGDAVASVFMDRILGVASVLLMAVAGLLVARDLATDNAVVVPLAIVSVLCVATIFVVFSHRAASAAATLVSRVPIAIARRVGASVIDSIRKYRTYPGALFNVLLCSIGVQVLRIIQAYCLGQSLGLMAPLSAYFAFIPLILLVMLLPVTPSGVGTGQVAFIWFFARAGVPQAEAFALSVLFVLLGIVGNVPGALLYVLGPERERNATGQAPMA